MINHLICIISLAVGYLCGNFETAYILGKLEHVDVRRKGSGNLGTTNVFRVMGAKEGIFTFVGDIFKVFFAILAVFLVFKVGFRVDIPRTALFLYAGLGVVLGHDFPFYLGFKGGKGVASTAAVWLAIWDWRLVVICAATFFIVAFITQYVSLASLFLAVVYSVLFMIFSLTGKIRIGDVWTVESIVIVYIMAALIIYKHRTNIVRLARGEESKFTVKHKNKKETGK